MGSERRLSSKHVESFTCTSKGSKVWPMHIGTIIALIRSEQVNWTQFLVLAGCSAYDNEAHRGDNWSNDSDDERYERSVLEKRLAASGPATSTGVVGSQQSLKTSTSAGDSLRSNGSSTGSARHSTGSKHTGERQSTACTAR